jgi:hypothetical protein
MKIRARKAHARVDKVAAGFTIIETILFLAIAAMVFTGVIVGTNGAIRRQRYKDTVQSFVDDVRDLYSLAENTEVLNYSGKVYCGLKNDGTSAVESVNNDRGRSDCSVYGVVAKLQMNSKASTGTGENIEAYWLIGKDEKSIKRSEAFANDASFLAEAMAKTRVKIVSSGGENETSIEAKTSSLFWGAQMSYACEDLYGKVAAIYRDSVTSSCPTSAGYAAYGATTQLYLYLMIYRSPISGAIRTKVLFSNHNDLLTKPDDLPFINEVGEDEPTDAVHFDRREVRLCVTAGDGMSYDGGLRMISIKKDAATMNDVVLVEADSEENICNK